MAIKANKPTTKVVNFPKDKTPIINSKSQTISEQLKLGESYVSLVLGAAVVLGVSILFFIFLKENKSSNSSQLVPTPAAIEGQTKKTIYVLPEGESLWDVAVKFYGDGYRYTEIIEANELPDPDYVPPGTSLIIPNIK